MSKRRHVSGKDIAKTFVYMLVFFVPLFVLPQIEVATTTKWILVVSITAAIVVIWFFLEN